MADKTYQELLAENDVLRMSLEEAEETLRAIGSGEVDAFVLSGPDGDKVFTLKDADQSYRHLVEAMNEGAATLIADGTIYYCNQRLADILQIPLEKLIGTTLGSYMTSEDQTIFADMLVRCIDKAAKKEFTLLKRDGGAATVTLSCGKLALYDYNGISVVISDITEQKHTEDELAKSEMIFNQFMNNSPSLIYIKDEKLRLLKISKNMEALLGKQSSELIGKDSYEHVPPEFAKSAIADDMKVLKDNKPVEREEIIKGRVYSTLKFPIHRGEGQPAYLAGFSIDITERKLAEDVIKSLLAEKDLILKEVHHRIKNNMSIIKSLLMLQAKDSKEPAAINTLNDAGNRIQSMMVLYDKLYQSPNFNEMSIKNYLPTLVDLIISNFPNSKAVRIDKNIDDFILDSMRLSTLGIIINELLTNIMKYAFADRADGLITVSALLKDNQVSIIIQDNGVGVPESVNVEKSTGFGLQLVMMLTKQLRGSIQIENVNGVKVTLKFEK